MDFNYQSAASQIIENVGHISVSGVQEKLSAVVLDGKLTLTPPDMQSSFILKPAPSDSFLRFRSDLPANEHLTMLLARHVYDIEIAGCAMAFFKDGSPCYITRRFDILPDGRKVAVEDFASLLGKTANVAGSSFKYEGSYMDVAETVRKYVAASPLELAKLYRIIVFNYLYCNGDAHLKNFMLIQGPQGDYRLAPSYDLLNTSVHIDDGDFALKGGLGLGDDISEIYRHSGHPCRADFEFFGQRIGLPNRQIDKILSSFAEEPACLQDAVDRSLMSDKARRLYLRSYRMRLARFCREEK